MWKACRKPAIVALTETWLCEGVGDSEVDIPGYNLFRCDRKGRLHGGVLLFVSTTLKARMLDCMRSPDCLVEQLWISVKSSGGAVTYVGVIYRSPISTDLSFLQQLRSYTRHARVCLLGDLNCPHICWSTYTPSSLASPVERAVLDEAACGLLHQHVLKPTRFSHRGTASCLDLILTRGRSDVTNVVIDEPISTSDHCTVQARLRLQGLQHQSCRSRKQYWRADYDSMRHHASRLVWSPSVPTDVSTR